MEATGRGGACSTLPTCTQNGKKGVTCGAPAEPDTSVTAQDGCRRLRCFEMSGQRLPFNSRRPLSVRNEYFQGEMLFIINPGPDAPTESVTAYLNNHGYCFELRIQGRFTAKPEGTLYMGAELPRHVDYGLWLRPIATMVMNLGSAILLGLHYSFGVGASDDPMGHEKAHVTWPLITGMDRIVVTSVGESPPSLHDLVPESNEQRDQRRQGDLQARFGTEDVFEVGPTYTFSFASSVMDLVGWRFQSVALLDLKQFIDDMSIQIVVYDLLREDPQHMSSIKRYFYFSEVHDPSSDAALLVEPPEPTYEPRRSSADVAEIGPVIRSNVPPSSSRPHDSATKDRVKAALIRGPTACGELTAQPR